ncbi:MAG: deoxynucleoside kinase [Proteobacteria bacterium]|nr:deoxynucleoside kinase [Pseudomonadota bacterium]
MAQRAKAATSAGAGEAAKARRAAAGARGDADAKDKPHQFIVVEGPIGVGKTSLARRLCESLSAEGLFEQAANNPFLERFYRNPRAGALPAQLYFLLQRAQQLAALKQADLFTPARVADFLVEKDRLFARVTLDEAEYQLYEQLHSKLDIQAPKPDLVVYLQAPVDVLLERIARRGVGYEQHMERAYLEKLNEAYARFFHEYEAAPLLIVNAASIDPIASEHDYAELLAAIRRMHRGRLYYNPLRSRAM